MYQTTTPFKGLWMGGVPPVGYDPHPDPNRRELVVNQAEANVVRQIFDLYATHKCLGAVTREAGLRSKRHDFKSGRIQGGNPFSRGQIHKLLTNPVYLGLIRHKRKIWPGLHTGLIEPDLWDQVQALLQAASAKKRGGPAGYYGTEAVPLKGKFRDDTGDILTPSHSQKRGLTFEKAMERFLKIKLAEFDNDKHRKQWRATLDAYAVPALGGMLVSDITVQDIQRTLQPIWATKTETASRLRGRIEAVMAWATVAGHRTGDNPAQWRVVGRGVVGLHEADQLGEGRWIATCLASLIKRWLETNSPAYMDDAISYCEAFDLPILKPLRRHMAAAANQRRGPGASISQREGIKAYAFRMMANLIIDGSTVAVAAGKAAVWSASTPHPMKASSLHKEHPKVWRSGSPSLEAELRETIAELSIDHEKIWRDVTISLPEPTDEQRGGRR